MADSNENLFNQKYLVQRCHRDQKFYRNHRIVPENSIIYKLVNSSDSCADYNGKVSRHQNNWIDSAYEEKQIKDPFGLSQREVAYSLNKKKRWNIHEILYENIENYQNSDVNLRISTIKTNQNTGFYASRLKKTGLKQQGVSEFAGYSQRHESIVKKRTKRMKLGDYITPENLSKKKNRKQKVADLDQPKKVINCEDKHIDVEKWEHDLHVVYVTENEEMTKNRLNSLRHKYYESRDDFMEVKEDLNDATDFVRSDSLNDNFEISDDETNDRMKPSFSLEDFIIIKSKKSKKNQLKKAEVQIETPKIDEKIMAERLRIFNQQHKRYKFSAMKKEKEIDYRLPEFDYEIINSEEDMQICDEVYPPVGSVLIENNEILVCRNVGANIKYYLQQPSTSKPSYPKKSAKLQSIYSRIFPETSFHNSISFNSMEKLLLDTPSTSKTTLARNLVDFTCQICYLDDSDSPSGFSLSSCLHYFCQDCWHDYLIFSIQNGHVPIECMAYDCSNTINPEILAYFFQRKLVNKYDYLMKSQKLMRRDVIECHRCDSILFLEDFDVRIITGLTKCLCGQVYCVGCKQKAHVPLTCAEKCMFNGKDGKSDIFYISQEEALCPGCGGLVVKTEGCNHMTCRCKYQFCYLCGETYTPTHGCKKGERRKANIMVDFVKVNIPPSDLLEIVKWRQNRDYSSIWCIKKKYRTKKSREMVDFVASQYAQICELMENAFLKRCIRVYQTAGTKSINRRYNELFYRMNMLLEKLTDPMNEPEDILKKIFKVTNDIITL